MRTIAALAPVLSVCAVASWLPPQSEGRADDARPRSDAPTRIRIGSDGFVLPAGDIDLRELIEAAAYYLQRNIVSNPDELQQFAGTPLHLQKDLAVDALGCEDVLSQLLYMRGFAIVETDPDKRLFEVIHLQGARAAEVATNAPHRSAEEILRRPNLKQYVVTEVPLQHLDADRVCAMLRPFFASMNRQVATSHTIVVGTMGGKRSLLLGGFQDDLAQAILLVRACDKASESEATAESSDLAQRVLQLEARLAKMIDAPARADRAKER